MDWNSDPDAALAGSDGDCAVSNRRRGDREKIAFPSPGARGERQRRSGMRRRAFQNDMTLLLDPRPISGAIVSRLSDLFTRSASEVA
jgi:hypothetical protein